MDYFFEQRTWEDYDEEKLDFCFDGQVVRPMRGGASGGRARINQLRDSIEAVRQGTTSFHALRELLEQTRGGIEKSANQCHTHALENPSDAGYYDANINAYTQAVDGVDRMLMACLEGRFDYLQQGMSALESAVAEIDALIAMAA